jgi:NodT family efflux transporter outer membrane factor (OMF) lipoprotein
MVRFKETGSCCLELRKQRSQVIMKKNLFIITLVPLIFAGCLSRDLKVDPDVAIPEKFDNASLAKGADVDDAAWWASFGDPQLSALVEKSLENNRSLKAAEATVRHAKAKRMGAVANMLPSVGLSGQAISQETLINPDGTTQGTIYGVAAQWDLDIFGMNRNKARAMTQMKYAAIEKVRGARMVVASETAKAYLTYLNVLAREESLAKAIAIQKKTLDVVQGRLPEGFSSTFDVDRAKTTLAATEAMMPKLELAETQLKDALALLTGVPATGFVIENSAGWNAIKLPEPPASIPSTVLMRRPDVQAAKRIVEAQMYAVGAAKAAYYPKFNFNLFAGNEDLTFSPYLYGVTHKGAGMYTDLDGAVTDMGLGVTLPIFTFGKIRAAVKGEKAQLDSVAALYENTILEAVADVETSYRAYALGGKRVQSLKESEESAAAAVDKIDGLYEGGLADLTNVLATKVAYQQQTDALLEGQIERAVSIIALRDALGGFVTADEVAQIEKK